MWLKVQASKPGRRWCGLLRAERRGVSLLSLAKSRGCWLGVLVTLLASCGRGGSAKREVWAEVNGHPIYRDEVESYYRRRVSSASGPVSDEQALSLKLNLLNELIDNQLLVQRAAELRLVVPEAEVDHRIAELQSPYSAEAFQKKLADDGLTPAGLREQVQQSLLVRKLLDREIHSRLKISPAEIGAYYQRNKARFDVLETRYHLAQILVTPAREGKLQNARRSDAVGRLEAERKVRMIEGQLRSGADFAQLAGEYSEDSATASGGGDMGFVPASTLAADTKLRDGVGLLHVGQVSGAIRDGEGNFHILKLLGREDAGQRSLSDPQVQRTIRDTLLGQREELLKAAYLEDLRNRAKVKDDLARRTVDSAGDPQAAE
jgi:peptidyl-prolyl cis-trans isomerase SurA